MSKLYNNIRRFCAALIGLVFLMSGILKLLDPTGTMLIVQEYLKFFHITFLMGLAKPMALALSLLEALVGAALLAGIWRRLVAVVTMIMMVFFTIVTLILLIKNPDMDCGCFGEAIHLTHFQTFAKNVILCVLCLLAFLPLKSIGEPRPGKYVGFGIAASMIVILAFYSASHLPLVDFTPYSPQSEIFSQDGNYDPDAPILSFRDEYGDYADQMATYGKVLAVSAYEPEKLDQENWEEISALVMDAYMNGANPLVLLCAENLESVPLELRQNAFITDYRTAIALNRSNGGLTYLEDGVVVAKWREGDLPSGDDLGQVLSQDSTEYSVSRLSRNRVLLQISGVVCLAVLLLL